MWWGLTVFATVQGSQASEWTETGVSLIVRWVCVMPMWHVYCLGDLGQWSTSGTSHNRVHTFPGPDPPREAHIWVSSAALRGVDEGSRSWILQVHRGWEEGLFDGRISSAPKSCPSAGWLTSLSCQRCEAAGGSEGNTVFLCLAFFIVVFFVILWVMRWRYSIYTNNRLHCSQIAAWPVLVWLSDPGDLLRLICHLRPVCVCVCACVLHNPLV